MLQLKPYNLLIQKTLNEAIEAQGRGTPLTLDRIISDFDYTTFHMSNSAENKSVLLLSIKTRAWGSLQKCVGTPGLTEYLASRFQNVKGLQPGNVEPSYDYTLMIDLAQLKASGIMQASLLKTHVMSYPLYLSFQEFSVLAQDESLAAAGDGTHVESRNLHIIQYRDLENIYVKPSNDRITVIFETIFQDETDKIFGKVFLQEFADARKRNRSIQSAPQVLFANDPPLELTSAGITGADTKDYHSRRFITFVLFPRHFQNAETQFSTVSQLLLFRNYFHYHIKCSKAYMHSRMRYRVDSFVKVLNRAKIDDDSEEDESEDKKRKTISGRKVVY